MWARTKRHVASQVRCTYLAIWREKKTGAHLSSFVTSTVIQERLLDLKHVRLLQHPHYHTY